MNKKERERLRKTYGRQYHCLDGYERMPGSLGCYYCGDHISDRDHCPPLAWVETKTYQSWCDSGYRFWLVPSCKACNKLLGDRPLFTPRERAQYIEDRLVVEYERRSNLWSEEEIAEMGKMFQKTIRARKKELAFMLERIRGAQWRVMNSFTDHEVGLARKAA